MKKLFLLMISLTLCGQIAFAQGKRITGKVTSSEDGLGIPGVSVFVKNNPDIGISTDIDGNYEITVPSDADILVFSSVGMKATEIPIENQSVIDVTLEPESLLVDEVVVIAYGTIKKGSFTGSATVVSEEKLARITTPTLTAALVGSTPGVQVSSYNGQPGAQSLVRIRGVGSLEATSRPLYVVDGIPVTDGDYFANGSNDVLSLINPADIESMTVLKDAAAAALYGSAAANGVVIITTKKGKEGESKINFIAKYGMQSLPKNRYDLMNSSDIYRTYFDAYYAEFGDVTAAHDNTVAALTHNPYNIDNPLDENGNLVSNARLVVDENWRDVVYDQGITQDYTLQGMGGTEKINYFASIGYSNYDGMSVASDFERISGKLNLSAQINDYIKMGMETTLGNSTQNSAPAFTFEYSMLFNNAIPNYVQDSEGNLILDINNNPQYNYLNPVAREYHPVGLASMDIYRARTYRAISSIWAEIEILKDLKFKSTANGDYIGVREDRYWNPFRGDGNSYTGFGDMFSRTDESWTLSNILTYDKKIGLHSITALAGYEATEKNYDFLNCSGEEYTVIGDILLTELINANSKTEATSYKETSSKSSMFGRLNYDFNQKYYFQGSLRRDGSSKFGSENRYGLFYSLSGMWRISEESFMTPFTWLSDLKVRGSYGTSGNDRIGNFMYFPLYEPQPYNDIGGYIHSQLPNSILGWEENVSTNLAVDVKLFNRIGITYEYYTRKSIELLYEKPLPTSAGFGEIMANYAELKNFGHEFEIQANLIAKNDFEWNVGLNGTTTNQEILKLSKEKEEDGIHVWSIGGHQFDFYIQEWAGVDKATGEPLWYMDDENGNKIVTSDWNLADRYNQGKSIPDAYGALTTNLNYKGFDFSLMLYYSLGGLIYDSNEQDLFYDGTNIGHNMTNDNMDHWTEENRDAKYPRFVIGESLNSYKTSSLFLHDATNIQLKNITLGYTIPQNLLNKIQVASARLYVSAENLYRWYADEDLKSFDADPGINGVESWRVPVATTISFGLNIGF